MTNKSNSDTHQPTNGSLQLTPPPPPSGIDTLETTFPTVFNWDYGVQRQELRNLYEKSKTSMWNARTDLPWHLDVDPEAANTPDAWVPIYGTPLWNKLDKKKELPKLRQMLSSYTLSNFLHGEQGALLAASQLVSSVHDTDAKFYAATQAMDEARHVEAYDRYLREKVCMTFPITPYLHKLLDNILAESRWDLKYLGMQIMVEGLALAAFGTIIQTSVEPLLVQLVKYIMGDEARHVAFGVLSLRGYYDHMPASELADREDFIVESSRLMNDRFLFREVWECMGMPVAEAIAYTRASEGQQMFRKLLFSKIVPNIKKLGLLTPRVRAGFTELDVIHFEDWEASA